MSGRKLTLLVTCCLAVLAGTNAPQAAAQGNPVVIIETNLGSMTAELDQANAPLSVANFLEYAESGHYSGTVFHRVIKTFMIQGGGFTPDLTQKPVQAAIKNEARNGLSNDKYTLAMARTNVVDSATSQFFVNTADNAALNNKGITPGDYGYAVFGRVTAGMDVVDKIAAVAVGNQGPFQNVPNTPVEIISITVQP